VLSAFLVNDVVCLALTPLMVQLSRRLKLNPVPYLLALATAANIGSTATITGNPQNMIIGSLSHIPYGWFLVRLGPVAVLGLAIDFGIIAWLYRRALQPAAVNDQSPPPNQPAEPRSNGTLQQRLLVKSLAVTLIAVVLFFVVQPIALVALAAAAVLLLDRVRPAKVFRHIDWPLLVMFAGLFVVVKAFEVHVVHEWGLEHWDLLANDPVGVLSLVSAALSNLVSNVPAVLLFRPVLEAMPEASQQTAWLALAMSSTLAGNLTVLGSVANLIVVEVARREGVSISFGEYARIGVVVTLATLAVGVGWLWLTR
jgi:Na+/H+ antiporter NhaD/arsenite permease-like protein